MSINLKKVLVVKLCCIGDIVQLTPSLRALKEGGSEVHIACTKWAAEIAALVPYIDKIHIVKMNNPISIAAAVLKLRAEKFELVINFHRDIKSYIFISLLGSKRRAGFKWGYGSMFLSDKFNFNPTLHETERYTYITTGLGYKQSDKYTLLNVPKSSLLKFEITENKKKVGIFPAGGNNPGTVMPTKRWPIENFNALIKKFESVGIKVYIFGAEFDRTIINKAIEGTSASVIISGLTDFAYYVSKMDVFIGCDTGPLHIAAALGVNTIGLYGPSSPEIFGARGKKSVNIWKKRECAPCYEPSTVLKREFLKCGDNICMKAIKVDEVFETANKILQQIG